MLNSLEELFLFLQIFICIMFEKIGGNSMSDNVLRIEAKKYREETVVVSSRIPKDMLQDIDFVAKESGRTRNEIITMFLGFALQNTEIVNK